jgi:hypothetical protein
MARRPATEPLNTRLVAFALMAGALLLLVGGLAISDPAMDGFPKPRPAPAMIQAAAFADDRLWLLTGDGALTSITEKARDRTAEFSGERVLALCAQSKRPLILTLSADGRWTLRRRESGGWTALASVGSRGDDFVGMSCDAHEVSLLTNRHLITLGDGPPRSINLSDNLNVGVTHSLLSAGDQLFVGANAGEFGGGLQRIDRRTGKVVQLQRNDRTDSCDAVLDRGCAPVTGVASTPWRTDCVLAAVGMVHMSSLGRLVEICGDRIEPFYAKALNDRDYMGRLISLDEVAFFGVSRADDAIWAVGVDGLYRFRDRKLTDFTPLPRFRTVDGVRVSFALPGVVLVKTDINQSVSLSGSVPMLVPR